MSVMFSVFWGKWWDLYDSTSMCFDTWVTTKWLNLIGHQCFRECFRMDDTRPLWREFTIADNSMGLVYLPTCSRVPLSTLQIPVSNRFTKPWNSKPRNSFCRKTSSTQLPTNVMGYNCFSVCLGGGWHPPKTGNTLVMWAKGAILRFRDLFEMVSFCVVRFLRGGVQGERGTLRNL